MPSVKQIQNVPTKYSKPSNMDPSPDLQKVGRALCKEVRRMDAITSTVWCIALLLLRLN